MSVVTDLPVVQSEALGLGFYVRGFWAAFLGALVVSLVSFALSVFLVSERREYH